ncbi:Protein EPIDERMAL PATTERNING FACTOR 1 [Striga hermonthica]|uniref:Epidermal patterning factor-like protein n=1 Tax=Striga hermonthica TaxID=68872 RepID=A0A9N7MK29_STRHE|nr:Protein EPIDERMAL PATTERNING FACTOR 1 [Striga hermonthica]
MKAFVYRSNFLVVAIVLLPVVVHARNIYSVHQHNGDHPHESRSSEKDSTVEAEYHWLGADLPMRKRADRMPVAAGSSLPDCTHACGSCTPCRLVVVSFVCSSLEEAETCPISYKCMCHDKSYPVP